MKKAQPHSRKKDIMHETDIIHRTMALLPLLNRKIVSPYKPSLPEGVTPGQLQILFMVAAEQPIRMQDLAEHLGLRKQQLNASIKSLENLGYVKRTTDQKDRRCVRASLTARGSRLMQRIDQQLYDLLEPAFDQFTPEEKDDFLRSLKSVHAYLERLPEKKTR